MSWSRKMKHHRKRMKISYVWLLIWSKVSLLQWQTKQQWIRFKSILQRKPYFERIWTNKSLHYRSLWIFEIVQWNISSLNPHWLSFFKVEVRGVRAFSLRILLSHGCLFLVFISFLWYQRESRLCRWNQKNITRIHHEDQHSNTNGRTQVRLRIPRSHLARSGYVRCMGKATSVV